jgi:hypothetical protein
MRARVVVVLGTYLQLPVWMYLPMLLAWEYPILGCLFEEEVDSRIAKSRDPAHVAEYIDVGYRFEAQWDFAMSFCKPRAPCIGHVDCPPANQPTAACI